MDYKKLLEEIRAFLSNCERVRYGELVGAPWPYNHDGPMVYTEPEDILLDQAATSITDLLIENQALRNAANGFKDRAEAAEARAEKAERERDAAYEAIKELIEEEDLPVAICREICENHDGMCCERAQIGIWDTCRGFKPRGQKEG